jgi:uncharacterized membrane protein YhfC
MMFMMSSALMILLPVVLFVLLRRKFTLSWKLIALGAGMYLLAQPLKAAFFLPILPKLVAGTWVFMLASALAPGIFEEVTKYVPLKWAKTQTWSDVLAFGFGFGGIEAIYLGLQFLGLGAAYSAGQVPAELLPPVVVTSLTAKGGVAVALAAAGLLERTAAIAMHMGFTFMSGVALRKRSLAWFIGAMVLHTVVDVGAAFIQARSNGMDVWFVAIEGFFAVMGGLSVWFMRRVMAER